MLDSEGPSSPPKVAFFLKTLLRHLHSFLALYQTNKPMVPFLAESLEILLRSLCAKFIRKDVLESAKTVILLIKLDVADETNQKDISSSIWVLV